MDGDALLSDDEAAPALAAPPRFIAQHVAFGCAVTHALAGCFRARGTRDVLLAREDVLELLACEADGALQASRRAAHVTVAAR
jgi:hypothetical protein